MTKEQYQYCVGVYKEVVEKQILDTHKLRKAANIIMGKSEDELIAVNKARQVIYGWYNYHRESFLKGFEDMLKDSTDTNTPPVEPPEDEQSHNEEVGYKGIALSKVEQLEAELEALEDTEENKKERRILKMRITKEKKKL